MDDNTSDGARGDHPYVDLRDFQEAHPDARFADTPIGTAEIKAIKGRRNTIKNKKGRDRTGAAFTGLAMSGGGIRSAAFNLGALQALYAYSGSEIDGIDYLSTVSGGGYIGCCLTAALAGTKDNQNKTSGDKKLPEFPFLKEDLYSDTLAVQHIRDHSNYLRPHGLLDLVSSIYVIVRGVIVNALIIFPVLFFLAFLTLFTHPSVDSLSQHGFWITRIFLIFNVLFLIIWAVSRMLLEIKQVADFFKKYEFDKYWLFGLFAPASKGLFFLTALAFAFDVHVLLLKWEAASPKAPSEYGASGHPLSAFTSGNFLSVLALTAAMLAFFSRYLGEVATRAVRSPSWIEWFKKIAASTALWFVGLIIPVLLWYFSLWLSLIGLTAGGDASPLPFVPHWAWLYLCAAFITAIFTYFFDLNAMSLHSLFEKRLSDAFLFDPDSRHRDNYQRLKKIHPKLDKINTDHCPYPIINASLNIQGSRYANQRGRDADFFIFTPEYTGSFATGYVGSRNIVSPSFDLGSAMAISGAAVSPNMGAVTIRQLTFSLAFLNIRLGYWLRNPRDVEIKTNDFLSKFRATRPLCILYDEMSWWKIDEEKPSIYLTDGGHLENLGIYELLRRRCKLVIAIDAEQDATFSFPSLMRLERYARIDLGVTIHLPWQDIADKGLHCAAGEIRYSKQETGVLLYFKAVVSGDEEDYILGYKRRHPAFPHETIGDQFFGEEQFEVYRALGFHVVKAFFNQGSVFAVKPRQEETEDEARARIRGFIAEALGSGASGPTI